MTAKVIELRHRKPDSEPEEKPLPCPFCNSTNLVTTSARSPRRAYVYCNDCLASGPMHPDSSDIPEEVRLKDAVCLWNLRNGSVHG